MSIKAKLVLLLSLLLIFSVLASLLATNLIVEKSQRDSVLAALVRTEQVVNTLQEAQRFNLVTQSQLVGILPILATVVENGDPATIMNSSKSYQKQLELPIFDVLDDDGELLVSVNNNFPKEENSQSEYLIQQVLEEGKVLSSLTLRNQQVALLATATIGLPDEPSGVLMVGTYLDNAFAQKIHDLTQADISFVVNNQITGSSLPPADQGQLLEALDKQFLESPLLETRALLDIGTHLLHVEALQNINGETLGQIVIQFSLAEAQAVLQNIRFILSAVGGGVFLIAIVLGLLFTLRTIVKPIQGLQETALQLAQGNLDQSIDVSRRDELGDLANSFADMRDSIRKKMSDLNTLNVTGEALAGLHDQTSALETVLETMQQKTQVEWGSVYLLNAKGELEVKAYYPPRDIETGHKSRNFKVGEGIAGKAAKEQRIIFIPDSEKSEDFVPSTHDQRKALLSIPLLDEEKIFGVMNFSGKVGKVQFDESSEDFAQTIARMTVITTKNTQMVKVIEDHSRTLEQKVRERTKEINDMLQNLQQGIFTFNPDFTVNPEHSLKAEQLFHTESFQTTTLETLLNLKDQQIKQFQAWIEIVQQPGKLKRWNKYLNLLRSKEIVWNSNGNKQVVSLEYRPILEENNLAKVMVLGTDITPQVLAQEALEQSKIEQERQFETILGLTANEKASIDLFFKDFETLITLVNTIQSEKDIVNHVNELFRKMHTLKGNSGSLGLKNLAKQAGELETTLATAQETQAISPEKFRDWNQNYENLVSEYDYLHSMRMRLFGDNEEGLVIHQGLYQSLLNHLKSQPSADMRQIYQQVYDLNSFPLQKFCGKYQNIVQNFSEQNGKAIAAIEFQNPDILVHKNVMHAFDPAIVHIIRNSIDHGIESNEEREQSGKGLGKISMALNYEEKNIILIITDNGKGIDGEKICQMAVERNLISIEEAELLTLEQKVDLVFLPGFSSKSEVTQTSGRGIGMDAIKDTMERLGGKIVLDSKVGEGLSTTLILPR